MRKSCGVCAEGRNVTFSDRMKRKIPLGDNVICMRDNTVHRKKQGTKELCRVLFGL